MNEKTSSNVGNTLKRLENYVADRLGSNETFLDELEGAIGDTLQLFEKIDFDDSKAWIYWVSSEGVGYPLGDGFSSNISQSTTSMIVTSILAATGSTAERNAHGYLWMKHAEVPSIKLSDPLKQRTNRAIELLASRWNEPKDGGMNFGSVSNTFGTNDLLTLSWHLDLFKQFASRLSSEVRSEEIVKNIGVSVKSKVGNYIRCDSASMQIRHTLNDCESSFARFVGDSAYTLLRFARVMRKIPEEWRDSDFEAKLIKAKSLALSRFEKGLHDQLSFSEISDSKFDPCELAFCLEGILHIKPTSVDERLATRVFDVIRNRQERYPKWMSETPILASQKGEVLYPISVETATSLISSFSLLEETHKKYSESIGGSFIDVVKRFWIWLKSRRISVQLTQNIEVTGWRSEKIGDQIVHSWENSQILEFLIIFRDYLSRHVASKMLDFSGISRDFQSKEERCWDDVCVGFENSLDDHRWETLPKIGRDFISPRILEEQGVAHWSMLLHGPPGTGKTMLAKKIASHLDAPLLTLTVSDFLSEGGSQMEKQAKLIFETLKYQKFAVVLFDELDQFILDRDSKLFKKQDSIVQFLTPGMLTKFANLRSSERVLFILATNYEDRIDSAIKRSGRFDKKYLILPPNKLRRTKIISNFYDQKTFGKLTDSRIHKLSRASIYLTFVELKMALQSDGGDFLELLDRVDREPRSIQFGAYKARFSDPNAKKKTDLQSGPVDEFFGLFSMLVENTTPKNSVQFRFEKRFLQTANELIIDRSDKELLVEKSGISLEKINQLLS